MSASYPLQARTGFGSECSPKIKATLAEETKSSVCILNHENVAPPIAAYSHLAIIAGSARPELKVEIEGTAA